MYELLSFLNCFITLLPWLCFRNNGRRRDETIEYTCAARCWLHFPLGNWPSHGAGKGVSNPLGIREDRGADLGQDQPVTKTDQNWPDWSLD